MCVSPTNRKNTVFLQVFYFFVFNCQVVRLEEVRRDRSTQSDETSVSSTVP